jgi:hypothetical protein
MRRLRRYGLWAFRMPRPLTDRRILRESVCGESLPTEFERAVGIRHLDTGHFGYPDCKGGYLGLGPNASRQSLHDLGRLFFSPDHASLQRASVVPESHFLLASATGFAMLWAPRIRYVSAGPWGRFVATYLVAEDCNEQ